MYVYYICIYLYRYLLSVTIRNESCRCFSPSSASSLLMSFGAMPLIVWADQRSTWRKELNPLSTWRAIETPRIYLCTHEMSIKDPIRDWSCGLVSEHIISLKPSHPSISLKPAGPVAEVAASFLDVGTPRHCATGGSTALVELLLERAAEVSLASESWLARDESWRCVVGR